ncbi:hypothetical protein NLJ89_g2121 [Agrocybe chaxingu]|uniref:Uncharacterized protein n=1 Tax=Agrocybe chaxingu TaxID=84603 RepID=A0A9W8K509_9AGAR|nr:hypothetical protein NLJ89_g2121 [Agrocybe chaxingu]
MPDIPLNALAALAKNHLSLPASTPDERVPRFYLDELRRHLALWPDEDNFRVTLQPKVGLGSVTCLKDGCDETIPLIRRVRALDGGMADGLGSLSAYRNHLSKHIALSRQNRAKAGPNAAASNESALPKPKATIKSEPPASTQPTSTSAGAFPRSTSLSQRENTAARVKSEPTESVVPRKRLSDIAFAGQPSADYPCGPVALHSGKKAKSDPVSKQPLTQVTNSPRPLPSSSKDDEMYLSYDNNQPHLVLESIRLELAGQENMLALVSRKPMKSGMDYQAIASYEQEIQRLLSMEQQYNMMIPISSSSTMPFAQPQPNVKTEPAPAILQPQPRIGPSRPAIAQPFPMLMDVDRKPIVKHESPVASTLARPLLSANPAVAAGPTTSNPYFGFDDIKPAFTDKRAVPNPLAQPTKPFAQVDKPTASSSKATPPPPPPPFNNANADFSNGNSDYDSDDDSYEYENLPNVDHLVAKMNFKVPPPLSSDAYDRNGDYHGCDPDLFVGPQASYDDLEKFLVQAGNAEMFDGNESVDEATKLLGLKGLQDLIPGMEVTLMAHQAIGVAWMVQKEQSDLKGGCLADEMGLGKTIQMIATILKNKPKNLQCKTTLIIAPLALLDQWKLEIETKTNCGLSCYIYHGSNKTRRKAEILKHDIVLTTYNTMSREWPDYEKEMKKKAKAKKKGDAFIASDDDLDMHDHTYRNNKRKEQAGLLFQVEFYRIITDEAQYLRNRRTRASRAITDVQATYRWCLTGTPIVNSLADAFAYLRFLRMRPWYDWTKFQNEIGKLEKKKPGVAVSRLQTVMNTFLLRRKKDSKLDGKPLIELPKKEIRLAKLEFSQEERAIYNMVETRSQNTFNRYLRAGTVLKNYHQVLVLLLRLRQVCSHPSLIQEDGRAFVGPGEAGEESVHAEPATELTRARNFVGPDFVKRMKDKFKQEALERLAAEKLSADATIEEEECAICHDNLTNAVITACAHTFCRECIELYLETTQPNAEAADGANKKDHDCPCCRGPINSKKIFSRAAFEPTDEELNPKAAYDSDIEMMDADDVLPCKGNGKGKGKARASARHPRKAANGHRTYIESDDEGDDVNASEPDEEFQDDEDDDMSDFIVQSDEDEEQKDARRATKRRLGKKRATVVLDSDDETPEEKEVLFGVNAKGPATPEQIALMPKFLPSTKMKYMMDQLQELVKVRPDEKTLIVSQWTGCLSLVSDYLTEKNIPHVKYQGDMNRTKRDQAVKVFMAREKARVMLMSLKCGGVGLNLTRANNVISLDLGWSQAVEAQAFDRVHRLGQNRKVVVQRVVIQDTVEDRILQMQERKASFYQQLLVISLNCPSFSKLSPTVVSVKEVRRNLALPFQRGYASKNKSKSTASFVPGSKQPITDETARAEYAKCETAMQTAVDWFRKECAASEARALGRVTPALLSPVRVKLPENPKGAKLEELATVGVRNGSTLLITLFNEHTVKQVEAALYESGIPGVVPHRQDSRTIKVPIPKPTVEARKELFAAAKRKAEEIRVQVRKHHAASLKRGRYEKHSVELDEARLHLIALQFCILTSPVVPETDG